MTRSAMFVCVAALVAACGPARLEVVELAPTTLGSGLVAHWTFDEGMGDVLNDDSGNRRVGTLHGGTWTSGGKFGGALRFNPGDWVSVENFPDATANWTFSAWIMHDPNDPSTSVSAAISTELYEQGGWEFQTYPGSDIDWHFGYWINKGGAFTHFERHGFDAIHWSHAAVVVSADTSQVLFYVDGAVDTPQPLQSPILPGSSTLYFGRWPAGGRTFAGVLDDVAVYARALSGAEIQELHQRPPPRPR